MSNNPNRCFRFIRSSEYVREQFQPYAKTKGYRRCGKAAELEDFRRRWSQLESETHSTLALAKSITEEYFPEQSQQFTALPRFDHVTDADVFSALNDFVHRIPRWEYGYRWAGVRQSPIELARIPLPDNEEERMFIAKAVCGNTVRRILLAGDRVHPFLPNEDGQLVVLVDSTGEEHIEYKTLLKVANSYDGRYQVLRASVSQFPFHPKWYDKRVKRRGMLFGKSSVPARFGDFLELQDAGEWWGDAYNHVFNYHPSMGNQANYSREFLSVQREMTNILQEISNHLEFELKQAIVELVDPGPTPDRNRGVRY